MASHDKPFLLRQRNNGVSYEGSRSSLTSRITPLLEAPRFCYLNCKCMWRWLLHKPRLKVWTAWLFSSDSQWWQSWRILPYSSSWNRLWLGRQLQAMNPQLIIDCWLLIVALVLPITRLPGTLQWKQFETKFFQSQALLKIASVGIVKLKKSWESWSSSSSLFLFVCPQLSSWLSSMLTKTTLKPALV